MPFTTVTTNAFIDAFHGKTTYTAPANIFAALSTTTPVIAGTNFTEPSGNAYARVAVPGTSFATAAAGSGANSATVTFPTPTGAWGTVTHVGFWSAVTGGTLLAFDDLPIALVIQSGNPVSIASSAASDAIA